MYSRGEQGENNADYSPDYESDNLWDLDLNATTGKPDGTPRRISNWSGFAIVDISATSDGKRLSFLRSTRHSSVFVGDLANNMNAVLDAHRLTMDDHSNVPLAWTPDSQQVVFGSRRTQALQIYKQAYNGNTPPQLVTQGTELNFYNARVAPDGASLILVGVVHGSTGFGFYRVAINGGAPQLLFKIEGNDSGDFRCTIQRVNLCVYGLYTEDRKELRVIAFPQPGVDTRELLRIPVEPGAEYHWGMSPDGSWIGIEKSYWDSNQIRFIPVHGGETRTVTVQGYTYLQSFDWAQDSKSVFVAAYSPGGSVLLHVGLNGSVQPIWRQAQSSRTWGIPSPDGRHITMFGTSREANVWLLDNF